MPRSRNRRLIHRNSAVRSPLVAKRRRASRYLGAETLERRILLTTITSVNPAADLVDAPARTDISATFDEPINPVTATHDTLVVSRESIGKLTAATATISTDGQTVTLNPSTDLLPGEIVRVTATNRIQSTGGTANEPRVWEFRTAVNAGSGQFVDSGQRLGTNQDGEIGFGDLDADGDLDVVQGGNIVWINDGSGNFTDSGQRLGGPTMDGVSNWDLADIDGDGDQDIVEINNVYLNDGSAVFSGTGQDLTPGVAAAVEVGDIDGDGDVDAMVGIAYTGNLVWVNDGNGNFTNTGQSLGTSSSLGIGFGDFDNDGDLDAYVANNGSPNRVWVNDGSGVFTDSTQALGGFQTSVAVDVADLDGDGDLDALVANAGGGFGSRVWLNNGSGIFTETGQQLNAPTANFNATLGDIDGDGDLDAYMTGWYNPSEIWTNDGSGMFTESQSLPFPGQRPGWIGFGDVDGDGDLDAFEGNRFAGGSRVFINRNIEPSVALSVDETSIAEGGGVATVTATLSGAHSQAVTIDLATSGSATATDDYTISGTQIVIAAGSTTGSVTITAVQDPVDEPDETVIVDITSITNGQGSGQVTTTILDDDEPIPVPDVTLTVGNAAIPENGGVATFTVALSVVTTVPVTVDLGISGTAAATDFNASGTQIVVPPGATTGTITVTAVDDAVDEPNETVVVDITGVLNGTESGVQQQTTTITDDDEPVAPNVTLTLDNAAIPEAAGVATFTVTLSEVTTVSVTVALGITGTAAATDYTASDTQVVIAPGETTSTITVTAVQDEVNEPDETVVVDIASVTGGNEDGVQQQTVTILDDDVPPSFSVTSLEPTASGFRVVFANPLDSSELNLYDTQNAGLGLTDVVVTGASTGAVAGSLVVDTSAITFIKSGGPLVADTYTVTLRSATDGFKDAAAMLLDGNGDGTGGDDYVGNFTVAEALAGARTVTTPDFVRGPGQDVNLPADATTGIPITISDGDNVRAADVRISYDPALLEITGATAAAGGSVIVNTTTAPGVAILVFFSSASLPAGSSTFINLQATVPAGADYGGQQVLDFHSVTVGDGNDNEFPVVVDDALHFSTYFADVSGNGRVNASDAAQVARFAALIDGGFASSLNTDPIVVGDISGNGRINAADASRVAQFAALIEVPEIPPIPSGVAVSGVADLGSGLPDLPARQVAPATSHATDIQSSAVTLLPPVGPDPYQAVDTVMASIDMLDDDEWLILALEDAMAELLSAELLAD